MVIKMKKIFHDQAGTALVISLLMMMLLTLIGLGSLFASTFEVKLSGNKRGATDAFYSAESGIEVVMANIHNFDLSGKYVDNKYDPFTDSNNPNPTKAKVLMVNIPDQKGAPRGMGMSATHFEFEYYTVTATGRDRVDLNPVKSTCTLEQKVARIIPTLQGGY